MTLKHSELTVTIIGCAMEVHRCLGPGFQEYIYQRALAIELKKKRINFDLEYEMKIFYKGEYIGLRRADFLVEKIIVVEIKAIAHLQNVDLAQALNYLEASEFDTGLLVNLGSASLEFKRLHKKISQ